MAIGDFHRRWWLGRCFCRRVYLVVLDLNAPLCNGTREPIPWHHVIYPQRAVSQNACWRWTPAQRYPAISSLFMRDQNACVAPAVSDFRAYLLCHICLQHEPTSAAAAALFVLFCSRPLVAAGQGRAPQTCPTGGPRWQPQPAVRGSDGSHTGWRTGAGGTSLGSLAGC